MRVFVAGGSGVVGRRVVAGLVARGHQVSATGATAADLELLHQLGAAGHLMNAWDAVAVGEVVAVARPDVIVNQTVGLAVAYRGRPRSAAGSLPTARRSSTDGIDNLLGAAQATGVSRVITESRVAFNGIHGDAAASTPSDLREVVAATRRTASVEQRVIEAGGAALRYGALYGAETNQCRVALVGRRKLPLVARAGGCTSWVHVDDAAHATVLAVDCDSTGVLNIVDDEPAPESEWLPHLARCVGARPPVRIPRRAAWMMPRQVVVGPQAQGPAASNSRAKRELGWVLRYPSWREGFETELMAGLAEGTS